MADSNITKRALASAIKMLMDDMPFEKISVSDICDCCDMSRKSFYYHFRDKYDLINWIFDEEFLRIASAQSDFSESWIVLLCNYLYDNRRFYRKALRIKGQSSFEEHFTEIITPVIEGYIKHKASIQIQDEYKSFVNEFISEAFIGSLLRWIKNPNCDPPSDFIRKYNFCVQIICGGDN